MCKTDYGGGGGGGKNVPKIDYVICERPLTLLCLSRRNTSVAFLSVLFSLKSIPSYHISAYMNSE